MLAILDARAKPYELTLGVVIKILPFKPVFWWTEYNILLEYLRSKKIAWVGMHDIFIFICPLSTSLCVEPEAKLTIAMQVFIEWFKGRTGDIVENWLAFEQMVDGDLANTLWLAWSATRDDLPKAPALLQVPAPVPVDENGNEAKPTKAGGKR